MLFTSLYRVLSSGKVIICTFETARIDSRDHAETFFYEVIENIEQMVGIENISSKEIMIFPNTAAQFIHIIINEDMDRNTIVELYNVNGQLVLQSLVKFEQNNEAILDISMFESGIYFYKISSEEISFRRKLIID